MVRRTSGDLGLYVHIPFCSAICNYCNFNRGLFDAALKERYVRALETEIRRAGRDEKRKHARGQGGSCGQGAQVHPAIVTELLMGQWRRPSISNQQSTINNQQSAINHPYFAITHLNISANVADLPCMSSPVRKILPAAHTTASAVPAMSVTDRTICHTGGPG